MMIRQPTFNQIVAATLLSLISLPSILHAADDDTFDNHIDIDRIHLNQDFAWRYTFSLNRANSTFDVTSSEYIEVRETIAE